MSPLYSATELCPYLASHDRADGMPALTDIRHVFPFEITIKKSPGMHFMPILQMRTEPVMLGPSLPKGTQIAGNGTITNQSGSGPQSVLCLLPHQRSGCPC